jgi:hypothetical protein
VGRVFWRSIVRGVTSCYIISACGNGLSSLSASRRAAREPEPASYADAAALKSRKAAADLQFVEEKKLQVIARRRETKIRNAQRKRELIPRALVVKQAAFLVISLRQCLLAIAEEPRELLNISDEREMARRLDAIVRDALSEIADMPLRVSGEHWLEKLEERDEHEATKRPRRVAE